MLFCDSELMYQLCIGICNHELSKYVHTYIYIKTDKSVFAVHRVNDLVHSAKDEADTSTRPQEGG